MIKICNNTPFETSISIHGECRVSSNNNNISSDLAPAPPIMKWFVEWVYILIYGPRYKNISFCIEPWSEISLNIHSNSNSSITMGFNDVCTPWKKHTPGIYTWNSKDMELSISCEPGEMQLKRQKRGPMVAGDISLYIITESNNGSWKVTQEPITMVQYSPTFNNDYYTKKI